MGLQTLQGKAWLMPLEGREEGCGPLDVGRDGVWLLDRREAGRRGGLWWERCGSACSSGRHELVSSTGQA